MLRDTRGGTALLCSAPRDREQHAAMQCNTVGRGAALRRYSVGLRQPMLACAKHASLWCALLGSASSVSTWHLAYRVEVEDDEEHEVRRNHPHPHTCPHERAMAVGPPEPAQAQPRHHRLVAARVHAGAWVGGDVWVGGGGTCGWVDLSVSNPSGRQADPPWCPPLQAPGTRHHAGHVGPCAGQQPSPCAAPCAAQQHRHYPASPQLQSYAATRYSRTSA